MTTQSSSGSGPQIPLTGDTCARCHRPLPTPRAVRLEGNIVMGCRACNPNVPTLPAR